MLARLKNSHLDRLLYVEREVLPAVSVEWTLMVVSIDMFHLNKCDDMYAARQESNETGAIFF